MKDHIKTILFACLGVVLIMSCIVATATIFPVPKPQITHIEPTIFTPPTSESIETVSYHMILQSEECVADVANWIYKNSSKCPPRLTKEIASYIYENTTYPTLIIALIARESNFDIFAHRSDTGVYGLGQIRYSVWRSELTKLKISTGRELYDYRHNINAINMILNKYVKQTKSVKKALLKYVGSVNNPKNQYVVDILKNVGELAMLEKNHLRDKLKEKS